MAILKTQVIEVRCPHCNSELVATRDDLDFSNNIKCPTCQGVIHISREYLRRMTRFPDSFFHTSSNDEKVVKINDEVINLWLKECIDELDRGQEAYMFVESSDCMIIVFKEEDSYRAIVTRDYYEDIID